MTTIERLQPMFLKTRSARHHEALRNKLQRARRSVIEHRFEEAKKMLVNYSIHGVVRVPLRDETVWRSYRAGPSMQKKWLRRRHTLIDVELLADQPGYRLSLNGCIVTAPSATELRWTRVPSTLSQYSNSQLIKMGTMMRSLIMVASS